MNQKINNMLSGRCLELQEDFNDLTAVVDNELAEIRDEIEFQERDNRVKIEFENLKIANLKGTKKFDRESK